ncbi:MAG: DNA repair protein RecO [Polyangiales bacterium]
MITDALLLRATDYRDADRIVTLFTRDAGKLSAIARGARGSKRRFAGALEPYAVIRVELGPRKGELYPLKRADVTRAFPGILADLSRMEAAGSALALVREAHAPEVTDPALFVAVVQYLTVVADRGDMQCGLLLCFALRVLYLMGIAPRLTACGRSGELVPPERAAYFDPALGAVVSRKHGGGPNLLSARTRERMCVALTERWMEVAWEPAELAEARAAVAAFVRHHVAEGLGTRLFPG